MRFYYQDQNSSTLKHWFQHCTHCIL